MRSSGRSLIRAYHAEKVGSGIGDEVLFGSSLSSELSRPFHPPILKSHSFDFGNSRSETPTLEEKREYNFFLGKRHSDDHKVNYGKAQRSRTNKEDISRSRPVSRTSLSLESVIAPRIHTPFKKSESNVKKARSIAAPDKNKQQLQKSEAAKQHNQKSKSKPVKSILKPSRKTKDEIEIEESSDEEDEEKSESNDKSPVKKESPRKKEEKSTKKRDSKKKVKAVEEKESNKIKPVSSNTNPLKVAESKEFIYRGSSTGFKYEGPFMKSSTEFPSPTKKESTEMLLSPKSENNSEHSLSYSQSTSSTKSEIISNIDILSARIRDSCVRIPPPEEMKPKPASASPPKGETFQLQTTCSEPDSLKSKPVLLTNTHHVGPGGDNNSTQLSPPLQAPSLMMANNVHQVIQPLQEINNNSTQYHQPGVLQQFQLFSADVSENNSSNSQQQFTITSPRIQVNPVSLQNVSSSPAADPSTQFQLVQQNVGYMQNIEPHPQTCQQIHYSPRLAQAQTTYPAYNTVSVMADPQTIMGTVHQDQFHHPNNGYPVEFPYFSFTTQDSNSQPTSVTIIQTNPAYDQQISPNHSSNASIRSPSHFNTNQNQLKPSTLPPIGYFSPNPVKEREQTFPNPNGNSKANQSSYDPTFYSNLDTWK
ncbi:unnamed protein product [Orchesella dallaii]|uniref:Uncharacterized protein n=1 Tax=Orchesella dallaii TaxID=48710 RepID=A0ABP1QLA7_9HEXA